MCIKKSHSCPLWSSEDWVGCALGCKAVFSIPSEIQWWWDPVARCIWGRHRSQSGSWAWGSHWWLCLWRVKGTPLGAGHGMGFPWHPTSAQSKTAWGIYSFSSSFLFYNLNFGRVFDSFYLLSHHSSSCTGAAPDVLNPWAGLSNHHLKLNPLKELGFFPLFFPLMSPAAFPTVCLLCYTRLVFYRCDAFTLLRMALPFITSHHHVSYGGTVCVSR